MDWSLFGSDAHTQGLSLRPQYRKFNQAAQSEFVASPSNQGPAHFSPTDYPDQDENPDETDPEQPPRQAHSEGLR